MYEEAFGSDTLLGEVTIEIARLATVKQKVAEWHGTSRDSDSERDPPLLLTPLLLPTDLRRGGRSAGEVCVELRLAPMPSARNRSTSGEIEYEDGEGAARNSSIHTAQLFHSHRATLLHSQEAAAMSGEWVGYFSHRAPASEGGGAAMQFASMQIELSDDGDAILGSGADGLGSFELQRGRRAVDVTPHSVEFSKVYTAVQAGYAPMGDSADGAAVEVHSLIKI